MVYINEEEPGDLDLFDLKKASLWQEKLSSRLSLMWDHREVVRVAGVDGSFDRDRGLVGAVVVVCQIPKFEVVDVSHVVSKASIPYIPGFLNFREGPAFIKAFRKLRLQPDVTLVDGNGIAHPRTMGLASFVGIFLDVCTIGCAKKPFFPFVPPEPRKGAFTHYRDKRGIRVGVCLRTRSNIKPVFVSPGHKIDITTAKNIILECSKYRIPEPIRYAHHIAGDIFKKEF